jgi:excisionase family DNA binding protein
MTSKRKTYFTSMEAAALLMVSAVTIREWARKDLLPSVSTAGGHRRFLLDSLQRFAEAHGIRLELEPTDVPAKPRRVLVVDDDTVFVEYLREIVLAANAAVHVESAADGFQAGQLTETFRPQLVVLDINMPGIDGIELCRRFRKSPATSTARLVVLPGALLEEHIAAARAAGADAWLEKGASAADILQVLQLSDAAARDRV